MAFLPPLHPAAQHTKRASRLRHGRPAARVRIYLEDSSLCDVPGLPPMGLILWGQLQSPQATDSV